MNSEAVIAIDIGASGGRCLMARFDGKKLAISEVYRFPNLPVRFNGHLRWNVANLFGDIVTGLRACAGQEPSIRSIGVDTWGVDYALLGPGDSLLDLPISYRDERTAGCMQEVVARLGRERIYSETGIQFLPFNTLYQLYAASRNEPGTLEAARHLLMMPDLFAFLLCGVKAGEYTDASTTQMLDVHRRRWSRPILNGINLAAEIVPKLVEPGTILAGLRADISDGTGLARCQFTATATHDTASAVAGIPAAGEDEWAFVSCGTWSLMGREMRAPIVTPHALQENFTNEGGVAGTIRFLKNIQGMWILQQCQHEWASRGDSFTSGELVRLATRARCFSFLLDLDDAAFLNPYSMLDAIAKFCRRTGQVFDSTPGAITRAILESLALKHRRVLRRLETLTGGPVGVLHLVGGGSRNRLLCQWTADATGKPVLAGPAEATAIGNAIVQGIALGWFSDLRSARAAVGRSVRLSHYTPRAGQDWVKAEMEFDRTAQRAISARMT